MDRDNQSSIRTVTITKDLLALAATPAGGYTKAQLAALDVPWPPPKGWKKGLIGKRVSREAIDRFTASSLVSANGRKWPLRER